MSSFAAYVYVVLVGVVCLFQAALAAGAPWGHLAMGGKYPGRFSPTLRVVAVLQLIILAFTGGIVLVRAGVLFPEWLSLSKRLIWGVVAFSTLSTIANLATPSKWERILWAPVAVLILGCSIVVALG